MAIYINIYINMSEENELYYNEENQKFLEEQYQYLYRNGLLNRDINEQENNEIYWNEDSEKLHREQYKDNQKLYRELNGYLYQPGPSFLSLQVMIRHMKIRKQKNMLYMPLYENHPINQEKMDEWINMQCNDEAKDIAQLFRDNTIYISWKTFYDNLIKVFDILYEIVKDASYCLFTKESFSNVNFNEKSNYWIIQLLLDYYIKTNKKNLPKKLLLCTKNTNTSKCLNDYFDDDEDYKYFITLDDCIYSGGQMFHDAIRVDDIDMRKIIVVVPFISSFALDMNVRVFPNKPYLVLYSKEMEAWWQKNNRKKKIKIGDNEYNLFNDQDLVNVLKLIQKYFPNPRDGYSWNTINLMYYFDHKIADYVSSFPTIYHTGLIMPDGDIEKPSNNTYNDKLESSNSCSERRYLPFLENCKNKNPIISDINENSKIFHDKLCVEPWYKKKYNNYYNKKVLVLDFDGTLTGKIIKDFEVHNIDINELFTKKDFIDKILTTAFEFNVSIFILSRRKKH